MTNPVSSSSGSIFDQLASMDQSQIEAAQAAREAQLAASPLIFAVESPPPSPVVPGEFGVEMTAREVANALAGPSGPAAAAAARVSRKRLYDSSTTLAPHTSPDKTGHVVRSPRSPLLPPPANAAAASVGADVQTAPRPGSLNLGSLFSAYSEGTSSANKRLKFLHSSIASPTSPDLASSAAFPAPSPAPSPASSPTASSSSDDHPPAVILHNEDHPVAQKQLKANLGLVFDSKSYIYKTTKYGEEGVTLALGLGTVVKKDDGTEAGQTEIFVAPDGQSLSVGPDGRPSLEASIHLRDIRNIGPLVPSVILTDTNLQEPEGRFTPNLTGEQVAERVRLLEGTLRPIYGIDNRKALIYATSNHPTLLNGQPYAPPLYDGTFLKGDKDIQGFANRVMSDVEKINRQLEEEGSSQRLGLRPRAPKLPRRGSSASAPSASPSPSPKLGERSKSMSYPSPRTPSASPPSPAAAAAAAAPSASPQASPPSDFALFPIDEAAAK